MNKDTLTIGAFLAAVGRDPDFVTRLIARGCIDEALMSKAPKRVRSVALPLVLLVDELARLIADGKMSSGDAASVYNRMRPQVPTLWKRAMAETPSNIMLTSNKDPDFAHCMTFLQTALDAWNTAA